MPEELAHAGGVFVAFGVGPSLGHFAQPSSFVKSRQVEFGAGNSMQGFVAFMLPVRTSFLSAKYNSAHIAALGRSFVEQRFVGGARMFDWMKVKCPVDETTRAWVDHRMTWIADTFGADRLRQAKIVLPTEEFFPDKYDGSEAAGGRIFDRVCGYCGVDRQRIDLRWVIGLQIDEGAAGTYFGGERQRISLDLANLKEPMKLVATSAHELCHALLLGDGHLSGEEEDHEPLTDLLTVGLGLGIFGANAAVTDGGWSDSRRYGWSVSRLGYLRQETWGYALAAFAMGRNEDHSTWSRHLRLDVRAAFKKGCRYLSSTNSAGLRLE